MNPLVTLFRGLRKVNLFIMPLLRLSLIPVTRRRALKRGKKITEADSLTKASKRWIGAADPVSVALYFIRLHAIILLTYRDPYSEHTEEQIAEVVESLVSPYLEACRTITLQFADEKDVGSDPEASGGEESEEENPSAEEGGSDGDTSTDPFNPLR